MDHLYNIHSWISFLNLQDKALSAQYNVDEFPTLMFFENQIPSVYDGELEKPDEILAWIADLMTGADIEQVFFINVT